MAACESARVRKTKNVMEAIGVFFGLCVSSLYVFLVYIARVVNLFPISLSLKINAFQHVRCKLVGEKEMIVVP